MDINSVAKTVFVRYRQLEELLKNVGVTTARYQLGTYNNLLKDMKESFAADETFAKAVQHLNGVNPAAGGGIQWSHQIEAEGAVLLATARAFIELYLSPEEKKKLIGFHSQ